MKKPYYNKIGAVFIAIFFLGVALSIPSFSATSENNILKTNINDKIIEEYTENYIYEYERGIVRDEQVSFAGEQNDINYNIDSGNRIQRSLPIWVGEPVDLAPGRGRTGSLDPDNGDDADYYKYEVCAGQTIQASISSAFDYDIQILDLIGNPVGQSYNADETGMHFCLISANEGAGAGDYTFSITLNGQNDANSGSDAGNSIGSPLSISPGSYSGYLDYNDHEDWYSFNVNSGQGIFITLESPDKNDMDVYLYNPSNELVHYEKYYGDDELEYPADVSGIWKIKIDTFPGWNTEIWPDDYLLYGSGPYLLELTVGGTADAPIVADPQPDIIPVAQSFIINDDPDSNKDEYGYIASIPATNYIENGQRYVSPIFYQGVDTLSTFYGFTTVDVTTQYLIDDWNTYLSRHSMSAEEFTVPSDPIQAAAEIATNNWESSNKAVLVCDGSEFNDDIETIIDGDYSLSSSPNIKTYSPGELKDFGGTPAVPMYLGKDWGAIHLIALGEDFSGDTGIVTPRYEAVKFDDWPSPYDVNGPDYDTWYPITKPGIWIPEVTEESGLEELQVILYEGNRYTIPVDTTDCSIQINLETEEESTLLPILVDPLGNVRRPNVPRWNGGEVQPIHTWNGGHWEHNFDEYRYWIVEPHTDFSYELHYPMEGDWTVIVVPYFEHPDLTVTFNGNYQLTANIRNHNSNRVNAEMSAANGAVIASINHAPLLYVTEDSIPSQTSNVLTALGVNEIIFVNIGEISSASPTGSVTEYTTMQQVIDAIKENPNSPNYNVITSLGSLDGYFAPSAMLAAYRISPVLNIGEAPDAYNANDKHGSWREWVGDGYHGCITPAHLPMINEPIDISNPPTILKIIVYFLTHEQQIPPIGLDLKLQWNTDVYQGMHDLIDGYGLDLEGPEGYCFVAPRYTDIRLIIGQTMTGNNSYAGLIPCETAAFSSAMICRSILYPAIIYANPGRDITTSQIINYPDGYKWRANDGNEYPNFATQELKAAFSSNGRFFEGHCIWENSIERFNEGVSINYYSGHGTGGSGVSFQYKNIAEDFPLAEPKYENLYDFDWWDAWRGYSGYDDSQTKTARWGGESGYSASEPGLYDLIHFKWLDQAFGNLHSEFEMWSSCSTGDGYGPEIYLAHGATVWSGAAGSVYGIQDDLHNTWVFHDMLLEGKPVGPSIAQYQWLFDRDYTTNDPTTLYGSSTWFQGGLTGEKILYADPLIQFYSPDWIEPTPIAS